MAENFQNFYVTKLREACDSVATTIYVETVPAITEGTLVLEYANSTKHEIIHFTGVSGYGLTGCTRGLEGTTAKSHSAGVDCRQNLTAGMIDKIINGVITTENIANSAVTTAKINDGAVTSDKIDFTTMKKWVPDYANAIVASNPRNYTATADGFVSVGFSTYTSQQTAEIQVRIDSVLVGRVRLSTDAGNFRQVAYTNMFPITSGQKITTTAAADMDNYLYFIPGKWA